MKTRLLKYIFPVFLTLFLVVGITYAQSLWYPDDNDDLTPNDETWGIALPVLPNCNSIDTNASGTFACGTDDGTFVITDWGAAYYLNDVYIGGSTTTASFWFNTTTEDLRIIGDIHGSNLYAGNDVYTAYLKDNFTVGSMDMTGDPWYLGGVGFQVTGDSIFDSDLTAIGTTSIGTTSVSGDLLPSTTAIYDLGNGLYSWKDIYGTTFYGDGSNMTGVGAAAATALTIPCKAGENLTKGDVVYISGSTGLRPDVSKADNTDLIKHFAVGMAAETKTSGQNILVRVRGELTGLDTSAYSDGDELYLTTGGGTTSTEPTVGAVEFIGYVGDSHAVQGNVILTYHFSHDITVPNSDDIIIRLGGDTTTSTVSYRDYSNIEVGYFDADGNFMATGTITAGGNITAPIFIGALTGNASTATALAANGANATSNWAITGVDASGAYEGAFDAWTEAENTAAAYIDSSALTNYMQDEDINTFDELQTWVTDATLAKLGTTTDAKICTWEAASGKIHCEYTDQVGGGGGAWSTSTDLLYPPNATDVVLIGGSSTTTGGYIFEVIGSSLFDDIRHSSSSNYDATHGWGDHSLAGYLTTVTPENIIAANATTDEYMLTYEATGNTFEWVVAGTGDITDVFDCSTGDCNTMTVGTSEYLAYGSGYIDANRFAGVTTVDGTEFGYLDGASSSIQTQIDSKVPDGCIDCLNATEIEDIYLLDDGDTASGEYNFGSNDLFISDTDNMVVVGSDTTSTISTSKFTMVSETPTLSDFGNILYASSGWPAYFMGMASGTEASPAIVSTGEWLGSIDFRAYDGTDFATWGARIWASVIGTPGENNIDADLYLQGVDGDVIIQSSDLRVTSLTNCDSIDTGATGIMSCGTDDDIPEVGDFDAFVGGNYANYDTSGNELDVDAELSDYSFSVPIYDATTTMHPQRVKKYPYTITEISCWSPNGTGTFQWDERSSSTPWTGGTDVMNASLTCGTNTKGATTSFANASIAAGAVLNLDLDTIEGDDPEMYIFVTAKVDD